MAKKQLNNYKFYPGVIPPAYNEFPNAVALLTANRDYIVQEATTYLDWKVNTPSYPAEYANSSANGAAILLANKEFIKEEANAWVLFQVENNLAPFENYTYGATQQTKCKRDIGYLIDAFYDDLIGGGNTETIRIARMFYLNGEAQLLFPEQEAATHEFVKDLMQTYVLPNFAYTTQQDPVIASQNTTLADSEELAVTRIVVLNDIVIDLINDGLNSLPALSYNYDLQFAKLVYGATKCKRDIAYILDGVAFDIALQTNYNAIFLGLAESNSQDIDQTVIDTINAAKTQVLALSAVSSSAAAISRVNTDFAEIIDIAQNGSTAADAVTFTNPLTGRTASQIAAKDRLVANKGFLQAEINAWVAINYPGYDHDPAKCSRDIGFLIDALSYDILYGGNSANYDQAKFFYYTGYSGIAAVHKAQTIAAYNRLTSLLDNIVTNTAFIKSSGNLLSQDLSGTAADVGDSDTVVALAQITVDVVNTGLTVLDAISRTVPSVTWSTAPLQAAKTAITTNSTTIQNAVVTYSDYTYDEAKCIRDTEYVIDSYLYDLTYGGNSLSYYVGSRYEILGTYTVNQPEVEVNVQTFVKDLITEYIFTNIYHPSYQLVEDQTVTANNAEASGVTQFEVLADIVIDVLSTGASTLPDPVAPDRQNGGLMPNAVSLLDRNKRFIQEESIAFIQYGVDNNIAPFVFYTYNASKCRRDVSYILEGYINDLKNGGNKATNFNASKYWENGVAQVDGDREPEIQTHTFIRDLIENYIWANVAYSARQILVSQVIDNANTPEVFANTRIKELSNTIIEVIDNGLSYVPTEISNRGYIKVPGYYKLKDFLLITNTSRNQIMFNFADSTLSALVTYSEEFDSDFGGALYAADKISQLTFDVDTSNMMVTDNIQIFVEGKEQAVRLNPIATDAMERMKVGIPQSMLDADFEYGLQPTKWQAIAQMRNYPSIYEIPGTDTAVTNVITDGSSGTGGIGASLITVTTVSSHGLVVGDPITIKALNNTISGFSRAEGTFLISAVTSNTLSFYAKSKVGTNGQVLATSATQLRKGGFYTGSSIGTPTFSVFSSGSSGTITTALITPAGRDFIGFTGTIPPIGAPLSGTGVTTGTQVTSVTGNGGVAASTTLASLASIGATDIVVNSTTGISPGLLFDRGDGVGLAVTNIVGNTISLGGSLTSAIPGTSQNYVGLSQNATSGSGSSALFTIARSGGSYSTTVTNTGSGYVATNTITINGTQLGGTAPTNNATITVGSATPTNTVATLENASLIGGAGYSTATGVSTSSSGAGSGLNVNITAVSGVVTAVAVNSVGSGYTVGETITITNPQGIGAVLTYSAANPTGTGYTTANGLSTTTSGSGIGLTVNIVDNGLGEISSITIVNAGVGYAPSDTVRIIGGVSRGAIVTTNTLVGGTGYADASGVSVTGGTGSSATVNIITDGSGTITSITIASGGTGYAAGQTLTISGGGGNATFNVATATLYDGLFTVSTVSTAATIGVATVTAGGAIQSVTTTGTPITATAKDFYSAFTISEVTTSQIASGNTGITYSAIGTIQVAFSSPHGLVPGCTITTSISSVGTGAQLAAGPFFVEAVPDANTIRYTARATGSIDNTLVGAVYGRPDSFFVHRPFDGGVQLGTASPSHGSNALRMSKKYIRYQSGKGVMYNTGALFAPSYDIRSLTATATTAGSVITLVTDDTDHGCQVGGVIVISGVITSGYNGTYTVTDISNERQLSIIAQTTLGATSAVLGSPCQMAIKNWHGATVRAGIFDDQNGMFWQYDGIRMAVVRRSSTFQTTGSIAINANSNSVTGTNTRFTEQLAAGDRVVIRGMTHVISNVISDTSLTVTPDFRGVSNVTDAKMMKTVDLQIPQEDWNLDALNGTGPSGYNLDVTKMQMIGIQHTWYGAGFIDFMLRGSEGNYVFANRFRNSNVNSEAYMRTGNQPVRYEVTNEGATSRLSAAMTSTQTTIPLENTYWFPSSGTVYIDNELIRFTGRTDTALTGCTRAAGLTQFTAGSQRTFTAGAAATHTIRTGVVLVSNTITPIISHWGSAFMIDGQFDSDRGYIFNYAATSTAVSLEKKTAFLIRLAPSVSNAIIGDLGEKELLNRAQLLLSSISITSDPVSSNDPFIGNTWSSGGTATNLQYYTRTTTAGVKNWYQATSSGTFSSTAPEFGSGVGLAATYGVNLTWAGVTPNNAGGIVVEGVLNPINYPSDPTLITWTGLATQAAGGQPSFAQIASGGSVTWAGSLSTTTATVQGAFTANLVAKSFNASTQTVTAVSFTAGSVTATLTAINLDSIASGGTYRRAINNTRSDFLITNTQYDALTTTITTGASGDQLFAASFITGGQRISSVTRSFITYNSVTYTRIVMTANGSNQSNQGVVVGDSNVSVTLTFVLPATYASAISAARTDFLTTSTGTSAVTDPLSATTFITGSQTISTITASYVTINGTVYNRIIMSGAGTASSTAGAGNNVTVTVTSAASATYTRAISTGRTDFLITDTAYDALGGAGSIAVGDRLSLATFITGGQTITSVTRSYITLATVSHTRIVMSSVGNSNSTAGSGNDQTVTVTAAGTAASYTGTNFLFFTSGSWVSSGATANTRVATTDTKFPAGTSVSTITTRTFTGTTVYRVTFTQSSVATIPAAGTVTFQFGSLYALPGETVFSFVANPGESSDLSLEALKELTSTTIGGRGTFPNGPDVLAINVYKVAGANTNANLILRWGEAQA